MSVDEVEFKDKLRQLLSHLSVPKRMHALQRMVERLRLIHNIVGSVTVMNGSSTVSEFQVEHPSLYSKLVPELGEYVEGGHLSVDGWRYFQSLIYEPRSRAVFGLIGDCKQFMLVNVSPDELEPMEV